MQVIDEEAPHAMERTASQEFPQYWTNSKNEENVAFDQMVYVSRDSHEYFENLLRSSYKDKVTQDRPCPKGTCAKTPGGCPCNKPGGDPGLPVDFRVRRVIRVEDSEMWARYAQKRSSIRSARAGELPLAGFEPDILTGDVAAYAGAFEPLDEALNECYLWHGTEVRKAMSIAAEDFKINLAGSGAGTMYGLGAYFAESSTKGDEYARDEPGGYYEGVYAMLLCRVCMGKYFYTTKRDTAAGEQTASGEFDSTCGDRAKVADTFREFVVYDADQLYPEYVVIYTRVHRDDDPLAIQRSIARPFHMQVPVYWRNAHKNPARPEEQFHDQCQVNRTTLIRLQNLAEASCSDPKKTVYVLRARRVEQSENWNRYNEYKGKLRARLPAPDDDDPGRLPCFPPANELDGNPDSGHVFTDVHLDNSSAEQAISSDNLDQTLNELLLWHGTSMEAAEAIVLDDFRVAEGKEVRHGARFGNGAYFAEDICKSLSYARASDGRKFILLCRVLCGDMYYTERQSEVDAGEKRKRLGKDCVLANPSQNGPREFIVGSADQVYPEYILEVTEGEVEDI